MSSDPYHHLRDRVLLDAEHAVPYTWMPWQARAASEMKGHVSRPRDGRDTEEACNTAERNPGLWARRRETENEADCDACDQGMGPPFRPSSYRFGRAEEARARSERKSSLGLADAFHRAACCRSRRGRRAAAVGAGAWKRRAGPEPLIAAKAKLSDSTPSSTGAYTQSVEHRRSAPVSRATPRDEGRFADSPGRARNPPRTGTS